MDILNRNIHRESILTAMTLFVAGHTLSILLVPGLAVVAPAAIPMMAAMVRVAANEFVYAAGGSRCGNRLHSYFPQS
jgi:hypothetical protein